ncbi:zinc finger protein 862-like [Dysidea avara]|uniref:zinc finger protein 862-like n=1 Tax=Dysidea avara TaxID=196820 RepID=UPI0033274D23
MSASKKQRLLSPFVRAELSSSGVLEDTETLPSSSSSSTSEEMATNLHHDISTRKFLPRWKYLFPWVEVEDDECSEEFIEKLYCRECRAAGLKNDFALRKVRPAKGWKKEYLRRHADSSDHSRIAPQVTAIAKTASSMFKAPKTSASERETLGLLINIHFLATNGLSMNKGAPLHSLVDFHILFHDKEPVIIEDDLEEVSSLSTTASTWLSKTHRSTYSTWEFVHALNAVTESEDVAKLQKARYFSLLLDESNDISCAKNLMVYCQFLDRENNKKELKFMKLLALKECDPDSIFKSVAEYFHEIDVSMDKMIMFTSDGASVMLGCSNGVQAKLKSVVPHLMEFHCVAHREALSVSQAYQIQKLFDIRWLSRLQAVRAVVRSYEVLVTYFEDQSNKDTTADGIAKRLKKYRFVVSLHFLCDILSTLGQLNKTFQIPTYHPCDAHRKVTEVIKALKNRYLQKDIRWGPYTTECIEGIAHHTIQVEETELQKQMEEKKRLETDVAKFVQAIVNNLTARFPSSDIIQAARIFDPAAVPGSDTDCAAYGERDLLLLTSQYSSFVDHNLCSLEWDTLKHCMKISYARYSLREFMLKLATDVTLIMHYPSLSKLAEIVLIYPSSTSEVERGFSYQNATKTKFRNRLSVCHLDQLLRLRLNASKPTEFPFHEAYKKWVETKHRRYVIPLPEKQNIDLDDSDSSDSE